MRSGFLFWIRKRVGGSIDCWPSSVVHMSLLQSYPTPPVPYRPLLPARHTRSGHTLSPRSHTVESHSSYQPFRSISFLVNGAEVESFSLLACSLCLACTVPAWPHCHPSATSPYRPRLPAHALSPFRAGGAGVGIVGAGRGW